MAYRRNSEPNVQHSRMDGDTYQYYTRRGTDGSAVNGRRKNIDTSKGFERFASDGSYSLSRKSKPINKNAEKYIGVQKRLAARRG